MRGAWIVVAVIAVLAGCGGGDDAPTGTATTAGGSSGSGRAVPKPAQPVAELLPAIERLGPQSSCTELVKLINPAALPEREGGANARNCNSLRGLFGALRGFRPTDSAEFGTAAVIDGKVGGNQVAFVAVLDQTKQFKLNGISIPRAQVGTKPRTAVSKRPAAAFVEALRDGDCKAAHAAVAPFSRLAYANEKEFCSRFKDTFMTPPAGLGARLRADPDAELVDLGGTRDAHFFALATRPAGYRTVVVGTLDNGDARVTDAAPVER